MLNILQAHLLRAFVANSKIDAIYALYPESFCDKNLAVRKVFAFCDSGSLHYPPIGGDVQPEVYLREIHQRAIFSTTLHSPVRHQS